MLNLPSGFLHLPRFLAEPNADRYLAALKQEVPWEHKAITVYGREVMQPRLVAYMGDHSGLSYTYSRTTVVPTPWTGAVLELKAIAEEQAQTRFNVCLLNHYRSGRDSMGWHSDDEAELGPEPVIASWSFGATRPFVLRRRRPAERSEDNITLGLGHGDLLIMHGRSQADWQHALPRRLRVEAERINLTFRVLLRS